MAEIEDNEKQTYTLELDKYEFCLLARLAIQQLKSDEPGPMFRHRLHVLIEKMKNAGHDTDCVEENWEEIFGGSMTPPNEIL